jgi:hypothetical protein
MSARWLAFAIVALTTAVARAEPRVTTLARDVWGPTALAVDEAYLYFVTLGDGNISRVARGGGGKVQVLAARQAEPIGIAVDESYVYWLARGNWKAGASDGALLRAPKSGGKPQPLASDLRFPRALALDGPTIWMLVTHDTKGSVDLVRVARSGGKPSVVWNGPDAVSFAVGADAIYLGSSDGVLRRIAKSDGTATEIATRVMVSRPAVTPGAVFASTSDGLVRWPVTGGAPMRLGREHFSSLAAREAVVFAAEPGTMRLDGDALRPVRDGRIVAVPAQGGELRVVADHQEPGELIVDGSDLFWTDGAGRHSELRNVRIASP